MLAGDPSSWGRSGCPTSPTRASPSCSVHGIYCDDGDAWRAPGGGARRRPAGRARGQGRSRDPAAAAAYHETQAKKMAKAMVKGDPERVGVMEKSLLGKLQEIKESFPGGASSGNPDAHRGDGRAARGARLPDPDRRPEQDGTSTGTRRRSSSAGARGRGEGLGYTYGDVATWHGLIESAARFRGRRRCPRGRGRLGGDEPSPCGTRVGPGVGTMAMAAVDMALWDLKARLLGCRSSTLLDAAHDAVPDLRLAAASPPTRSSGCRSSSAGGSSGDPAREDEGRARPGARSGADARRARGDRRRHRAVRRRERRASRRKQALSWAERFHEEWGVSLVRRAGLLRRLGRTALAPRSGAGRARHRGR